MARGYRKAIVRRGIVKCRDRDMEKEKIVLWGRDLAKIIWELWLDDSARVMAMHRAGCF